jgi:gliding motility-associated-like protein
MNRFIAILGLTILTLSLRATHNRAGEITYKRIEPFVKQVGGVTVQVYTYSITVIKYTDDGPSIADRCVDTVYFGDRDRGIAPRINGFSGCGCGSLGTVSIGCGSVIVNDIQNNYRVKLNIYTIIHTYPGPGTYIIRTFDPNRNLGVENIPNSVNLPFYIESMLVINNISGSNSSPVFAFPPVDRGCVGTCFQHNPGAYDPDLKDSLSFEITASRGVDGKTVTGYSDPNAGPNGVFKIDAITGHLDWCTPQKQGEYNIAFIVNEWRKNTSGNYERIGYVIRDMQVIVGTCPKNNPPQVIVPKDTCVEAGTLLQKSIIVKDPNGNTVFVEGKGGPFNTIKPVATLNPTSGITSSANGFAYITNFEWKTTCDHIRSIPYQATFKAEDQSSVLKLTSFSEYLIQVIPPSVKNVTATPEGSNMRVTWVAGICNSSKNPLKGFQIYRKNDCVAFNPAPCTLGVPATSGFELIGETGPTGVEFVDTNHNNGLVVGQNYSYIVVAVYEDGTVSYRGTQVCSKLRRNVPLILNVDVLSTATTGSVQIKWELPVLGAENFDTLQFKGPYTINVMHRADSVFVPVKQITSATFKGLEVQFIHGGINTISGGHEYFLEFKSGTVTIGASQRATSVFLTIKGADRSAELQWSAKTPWENYSYTIHRKDPGASGYAVVGQTTSPAYVDRDNVVNRQTYCYYVTTEGKYSDTTIIHPLFNRSQESCVKAEDKTPPCAPTLSIDADCPIGYVKVIWNDVRLRCTDDSRSDDVVRYDLYFKETVKGEYRLIATFSNTSAAVFEQLDRPVISGCYAMIAIDSSNNQSGLSPDFCLDNCPIFELPNIYTPNDDDVNDYFKAIRVRQIAEIDLMVFDRWGNLVYKTHDPYFKWDGISIESKLPVSDGTFFYICHVFEPRLQGTLKRTLKGYVEVAR